MQVCLPIRKSHTPSPDRGRPRSTRANFPQCSAIPHPAVPGIRACPLDRTSKLHCRDRFPYDASRRVPTSPPRLRPAGLIRAPASNRPWHPNHSPARASVSPAGGSVAVRGGGNRLGSFLSLRDPVWVAPHRFPSLSNTICQHVPLWTLTISLESGNRIRDSGQYCTD